MLKSGEYIKMYGHMYLFLGYSDYKRKYGVLADYHGNKHIHYFGGWSR
jgi:hypothetical protein